MSYQCPAWTYAETANSNSGCINRGIIAYNRNRIVLLSLVLPGPYEVLCPDQGLAWREQ